MQTFDKKMIETQRKKNSLSNTQLNSSFTNSSFPKSSFQNLSLQNYREMICTITSNSQKLNMLEPGVIQRHVGHFKHAVTELQLTIPNIREFAIALLLQQFKENYGNFRILLLNLLIGLPIYSIGTDEDPISQLDVYTRLEEELGTTAATDAFHNIGYLLPGEELEPVPVELDEFDSDSDDEFANLITLTKKDRSKKSEIHHPSNDTQTFFKVSVSYLEFAATVIHEAGGGDSRLTVVCAQFQTRDGTFLRIVTCNRKLLSPEARRQAAALGFYMVQGEKSHAETNMLLYATKHKNDLIYMGHGCDKAACKQCQELLEQRYGEVDFGSAGVTGKFSGTYFNQELDGISSTAINWMRESVRRHYDIGGHALSDDVQQKLMTKLKQEIDAGINDCLINTIAEAAGLTVTQEQRIRIRLRLQGIGIGIGETLSFCNDVLNIVMNELGIQYTIRVLDRNDEILDQGAGPGDFLDIYYTILAGQPHFQSVRPA